MFAFLPYCQLRGANVIVDFFTRPLPERARDWLDAVMGIAFTGVAAVLAWRLLEGGLTAYERSKRSMFLQLPEWWGYAIGVAAMAAVGRRLRLDGVREPAAGARPMTRFDIGIWMFVATLALIALRMPVAVAMLLVGGAGYAAINGATPLLNTLKTMTFSKFANYTLSVIPLFLLMGEFATKGGMNGALFRAARAWFGHWRGGLAVATIGGCAAFGAICGSSLATAATMSQVAGPEMRKLGYSPALYTGTLAAGGTLGILIPPSVILVIYAVFTEQSIGALFVAAVIPGLIATVQYMLVVHLYVRFVPGAATTAERAPWRERLAGDAGRVAGARSCSCWW